MKAALEGADREDFVAFCPTFRSLERCLYRCLAHPSPHPSPLLTSPVTSAHPRWRGEAIPPTPGTQEEINLDTRYLHMSTKHFAIFPRFSRDLVRGEYQYPGEPNGRVIVLGSRWLMGWLEEREGGGLVTITRIGIDGTFKITPGNYNQLLIIHARIGGEVWCGNFWYGFVWFGMMCYLGDLWTPMFYILMPWRNRDCYEFSLSFAGV